jgi:hypothetical protein
MLGNAETGEMEDMKRNVLGMIAALVSVAAQAAVVPTDLPRPDNQPPSNKKPVKVYILSGQSNMVGFGALSGSYPVYPSIFLSPDPTVMPCKMPVGASALLPLKVYQSADKDAASGTTVEKLPAAAGSAQVVLKTFIEVPMTGAYQLHSGYEDSSYAVATLDGKEVYRRNSGEAATITKVNLEQGKRYPVVIIYLNGGSTPFWMKMVDLKGKGDLEWVVKELGIYKCLVDDNGAWTNRSDVIFNNAYLGKGSSSPLSATANGWTIGPELGFGCVMGTFHEEPVLLIKSCTGNRSIAWDYLPPGSERYEVVVKDDKTGVEKTYVFAGYKDPQSQWEKGTEPQPSGWYAGKQYDDCTAAVKEVLDNFGTKYPEFKEQGFEIAGFVWWQGHKDQNAVHAGRYEQNLVNLIKAWRKEFNAPDAKWVVATGCGNPGREGPGLTIAEAQLAVDGDSGKHPEFKGNVKSIDSRGYWRSIGESPSTKGFHYNHNAETYLLTGDALGRAMVELLGGKADPSPGVSRPWSEPKPWPTNPTPEQAVSMIYSDAFIFDWLTDPAEPTAEQMKAMAPALRPIIIDGIIPEYLQANVPGYLRRGIFLEPIITGKKPANIGADLISDLDGMFDCYRAAGIDDYGWKVFGPDMKNATWEYFSFDPAEKADPAKSERYRDVTYPDGMTNWFAVDFDAVKAGWKTGAAPFGQRNGQLVALRANCANPQCGCGIVPKTLWEKEVLLMRQTFEIPKLNPGNRYRLVVGGSGHDYSGEGFALYVNGKLLSEAKGGYYKRGGNPRGGHVWADFMPEFQGGKVTIAVKSFLRHTYWANQNVPPHGHISVWMEEANVPDVALKAFQTAEGDKPAK